MKKFENIKADAQKALNAAGVQGVVVKVELCEDRNRWYLGGVRPDGYPGNGHWEELGFMSDEWTLRMFLRHYGV